MAPRPIEYLMDRKLVFGDIVERVGTCIKRARELQNLSEGEIRQIDDQIEGAIELIEQDFTQDLSDFLDEQGVTERLRTISLSVVQALGAIEGYNVQPETGTITVIKGQTATSQPLTPLASAASLYFNINHAHQHFDFILACLSRHEYFEIIQLHHYFRNLPSQSSYRSQLIERMEEEFDADWDDDDGEHKKAS